MKTIDPAARSTEGYTSRLELYIDELETSNQTLAQTNMTLQLSVASLQSTVVHLENHCEDQRAQLLALEEEADDLGDDVEYLQDELEEFKERVEEQTRRMQEVLRSVFEGNMGVKDGEMERGLNGVTQNPLVGLPGANDPQAGVQNKHSHYDEAVLLSPSATAIPPSSTASVYDVSDCL